jgi:hypothetical protein
VSNTTGPGRPALASGVRIAAAWGRVQRLLGVASWADTASLVVLAALPIVMLLTLDDYGLTYDEEPHLRLGQLMLDFYTGGFRVSSGLRGTSYGAGFDLAAALLRRVSPWDEYRTNHILCIFVAQLGWLGTWKLGRLLAGPAGGLLGLGMLLITPVYYGHSFNNPKDIPFAVGYVWGLYALARLLAASAAGGPLRMGRSYWVGLALALGLGMSVRVGGAMLVAFLGLFLLLSALERWRVQGRAEARALLPVAGRAGLAALGGWAVMLLFWPRALAKPIGGPRAALETVTRYTSYDSPTLLAGQTVSSQHVPWNYLPTYFAAQLPELVSICFIGACVGLVVAGAVRFRQRRPIDLVPWLLLVAVAVPPLYAILRGSTLYNGLRHFLFIIPPLCVLAAAFLVVSLRWLAGRRRAYGVAVGVLCGLGALEPASALVRLHPHQQVYFNRASGGLRVAVKDYETEYYGSVYRELGEQLVTEVWRERQADYLNTTFEVTGCGSKLFFTRNLPQNFQFQPMRNAKTSDYYASYVRDRCLARFRDRRLLTAVVRDGATLAVARDLRRKVERRPAAAARPR